MERMESYKMMMGVDEHSIWMVKSQDAVGVTT